MSSNPFLIDLDPRFTEAVAGAVRLCQGCGLRRAEHKHHRIHKAMGGRKGTVKVAINREENLIDLCEICHMASHLEHHIAVDGFHCGACPRLSSCYWGRRTMRLPVQDLSPNW